MSLYNIATQAIEQTIGRLMRRAAIGLAAGVFGVVALYHFTVAGLMALEAQYGVLHARLIVAVVYTVVALLCMAVLWSMRRHAAAPGSAVNQSREMQVAMLVEAAMLGYSMARKASKTQP